MAQLKSGAATAPAQRPAQKPFTSFRISRSTVRVNATAERSGSDTSRRQVLQLAAIPALGSVLPSAAFAAGSGKLLL
ncbi:hypothetical protein MNEG_12555 [Monoraphidium neglectum]|uniref:Uncharacterized protein n=1 Tax=Monoraphidium neglectum TaxID=145388 RepID=A0A0D2LUX6_9CHLO|nr:hypothetical protein MNEG_12555 [Monoraphidium neglectum]KIY95409.1 hypothetical protein MNEG_12555 [Monoraphidium neglectum]|eukprot:XP_013894429.1 hypothetical protein MNEG_12555 [Monoraphidium neglectum]